MDSLEIARELERLHPEPSIHIDSPYMQRTADLLKDAFGGLRPIVLPRVPVMLLNPRSAEYFERTRAEIFSMPLSELEKSDQAGENGWKKAEVGFEGIKAMLEENNDGPYVLGKEVTFADFILAGLWTMLERVDRDGDVFGRTIGFDESFRRHYEACKGWLERDD
jgi:glutathione S-transferase